MKKILFLIVFLFASKIFAENKELFLIVQDSSGRSLHSVQVYLCKYKNDAKIDKNSLCVENFKLSKEVLKTDIRKKNILIFDKNEYTHIAFYKLGYFTKIIKISSDTIKVTINKKPKDESPIDLRDFKEGIGKPIIYLYPQKETVVALKVNFNGKIKTTYPPYKSEWRVIAKPDGKLFDNKGREYAYLFWDGDYNGKLSVNNKDGFVVSGDSTIQFLENSLDKIGLNPKEQNDFITYWAPKLNQNKYNYIHFRINNECNEIAKLEVEPKPESILRIYMEFQALDKKIYPKPQVFEKFIRNGFTLVEWGGVEIGGNNLVE